MTYTQKNMVLTDGLMGNWVEVHTGLVFFICVLKIVYILNT